MMAPNIIYCAPIPFNIVFHNANKGKMRINVLDLSRFCCAVGPFRLVFLSSPHLSLPLFTVGRATSRASTRREGGRNNPAGNILSLFHVLPEYFSSRNLSPAPFLFFFLSFFFHSSNARKALSTRKNDSSVLFRCFIRGMKFLIDGISKDFVIFRNYFKRIKISIRSGNKFVKLIN